MRFEAAASNEAVMLLEGGGALCDGSVFLMPPEVPEVSDLRCTGGYHLLGELPGNGSVVCRNSPPFRCGFPSCPGVVTVVRVSVEGGDVECSGEIAQHGCGAGGRHTLSCGLMAPSAIV